MSVDAQPPRENLRLGIFYCCIAGLLWMICSGMVKWMSGDYPVTQLVFFRSAFGLLPITVFVFQMGGVSMLRTTQPLKHVIRASYWIGAFITSFLSLRLLTVADATALSFTAPLFLTLLAGPLLKEKVGVFDWLAVLCGFVGVIVVARPSGDVLQLGAIYALISAVFYACGNISVRRMVRYDHPAAITFYTQLFGVVLTGAAMPFVWVTPTWPDFAALVLLGLGGGFAQFWNTLSMRYAPVSVIGPFIYTQMIWAIIIDYLVWSDLPSVTLLVGVAIIAASTLSMLYRHSRKRPAAAEA